MKKKIIALALAAALLCIGAVSATLAYFQDTEFDKNVMTVGNVNIVQNEYQRDESGALEDFEENKPLFPVTGSTSNGYTDTIVDNNGTEYNVFSNDINVVDKVVTVTNTGSLPAYVRTVFAFEMKKVNGVWEDPVNVDIMTVESALNKDTLATLAPISQPAEISAGVGIEFPKVNGEYVTFELNGVMYLVGVYYYANDSIVAAGAESHASLLQVYLKSGVGNEWYDAVGETYEILAVSQAVQVEGFGDAITALDAAFGSVSADTCADWFNQ